MRRILGAAILLLGCRAPEQPEAGGRTVKDLPLAEYRDTTVLDMHEGSRLSWRLTTFHLVKWPKSDLIHAEPVNLVVYDSLGAVLVFVTADSGIVDEPVNFMMAKGRVHGKSRKGMELRTDSLRWNKTANRVSTDARVFVVAENGDRLEGQGFVSDANLDKWQILSDVHGVFQKAGERAHELDAPAPAVPPAPAAKPEPAKAADSAAEKGSP